MINRIAEYDKRIAKLARSNEDLCQKLRMIDRIVENMNPKDSENLKDSIQAIKGLIDRALENEV